MEMNEILNGLNSCGCNDDIAPNCPSQPITSCCNNGGFGFGGSWIWILLILFYSGGFGGGRNRGKCCCKKGRKHDCCCEESCCCESGGFGGGFGNCTPYLFLLVILFLCNGSGLGNCGNFGCGNLFGGCC